MSIPLSVTQTLEREVRPEELVVLLEVRAGEAEGLLGAGLGVVADRLAVSAGKVLDGLVSAGTPATRKAISHQHSLLALPHRTRARQPTKLGLLRLRQATNHAHSCRTTTHAVCKTRSIRAAGGMG